MLSKSEWGRFTELARLSINRRAVKVFAPLFAISADKESVFRIGHAVIITYKKDWDKIIMVKINFLLKKMV